jgi:alpha-ribazole phosphatase
MILYFIRHGQAGLAEKTREKKLTMLGKKQAEKIGIRLSKKKFNVVYVSDFNRTIETFNAMKKFLKYDKAIISSDYAEVFGGIVGNPKPKVLETIKEEEREEAIGMMTKHGISRVNKFWRDINKMPMNSRALLIGHGNFFRALLSKILRINPKKTWVMRVNNGGMSIIQILNDAPSNIVVLNDLSHLTREEHSQNL